MNQENPKSVFLSIPLVIMLLGFPQISETIYTPSLPKMAADLETTGHLIEMTLSIYFLGFAVGVGLWGYCCDAIGRRRAMLSGLVVYVISCMLLWNSYTIESLLFLRFFQALGASAGSVVTQTMLRDVYEGKKRNQAFALVGGVLAFVPAIGPAIGGGLCLYFGWAASFLFLSLLGLLLLARCYTSLPETCMPGRQSFSKQNIAAIAAKMLMDRTVLYHVLLISLCNGIVFGFYGEAPFLFVELMEFSTVNYGLFGIVLCVSGIISSILSHRLNESWSPQEIIVGASACTLLGSTILYTAAWMNMFQPSITVPELGYIVLGLAVCFLGLGLMISNSLSIALNDYKGSVGIAGALFGLMYYLGIALCMGLVSMLHDGTAFMMPMVFVCFSAGLVFCSIQLLGIRRSFKKQNI